MFIEHYSCLLKIRYYLHINGLVIFSPKYSLQDHNFNDSSCCLKSKKQAALLLGQFAATNSDLKVD